MGLERAKCGGPIYAHHHGNVCGAPQRQMSVIFLRATPKLMCRATTWSLALPQLLVLGYLCLMAKEETVGTSTAARNVSPPRPDETSVSGTTRAVRSSGLGGKGPESPGEQGVDGGGADATLEDDAVKLANRELEARTADHLATVIAVLVEQRDVALRKLAGSEKAAEDERNELISEHDKFVAFLMEEQDAKLDLLQKELDEAQQALTRQRALVGSGAEVDVPEALREVRGLLETAYGELDEHKALVARVEEERDQALAAVDDVRVELYTQVEAARDEAIQLQSRLDDAHRELEEERDRARDTAIEASAELDEVRRELDERREEVTRLRERVDAITEEVKHSRPPPPLTSAELSAAREENQSLRKELIETKRALSRVRREYDALRSLRTRMAKKAALKPAPVIVPRAAQSATNAAAQSALGAEAGSERTAHVPEQMVPAEAAEPSESSSAVVEPSFSAVPSPVEDGAEASPSSTEASTEVSDPAAAENPSPVGALAGQEEFGAIDAVTEVTEMPMGFGAAGAEGPVPPAAAGPGVGPSGFNEPLPVATVVGPAANEPANEALPIASVVRPAPLGATPAVAARAPAPMSQPQTAVAPPQAAQSQARAVPMPFSNQSVAFAQPAAAPRPVAVGGWPPPVAPAIPYPQGPVGQPVMQQPVSAAPPLPSAHMPAASSELAPQPAAVPSLAEPSPAVEPGVKDRRTAVGLQPGPLASPADTVPDESAAVSPQSAPNVELPTGAPSNDDESSSS